MRLVATAAILLFATVLVAGATVLVGLVWLVSLSPLAKPVQILLDVALTGSGLVGGSVSARRLRAGRNPWSKDRPERG